LSVGATAAAYRFLTHITRDGLCKNSYAQPITLLTDCALRDRRPPTSLADGRHSVNVVNPVYRAIRERRVVEVVAGDFG
jgi:hypothetical protein